MTTVYPDDVRTELPTGVEPPGPPFDDVPHPARHRRTILAVLLSVMVLAVPLAVLVLVTGSGQAPETVTATVGPSLTESAGPAEPAGTSPARTPTAAGLPQHYRTVQLPRLSNVVGPSRSDWAFAMNDRGQVVGQAVASNGQVHPVLWQDGHVTDLGVLATGPEELGIARDINNRGDVVGGSDGPNGQRAVLWRDGRIVDLGTLPGDVSSFAYAINDRGQIVGRSTAATGALRAVLWQDGQIRDLGMSVGASGMAIARDINNQGQVVGTAGPTDSGLGRAFRWDNGTVTWLAFPGQWSSAAAINDRGDIVGGYTVGDSSQAVRWYDGVMTKLGPLTGGDSTQASAVNERGQILGSSNRKAHSIELSPVIWAKDRVHDLTAAGIAANASYYMADINERGEILAGSQLFIPA